MSSGRSIAGPLLWMSTVFVIAPSGAIVTTELPMLRPAAMMLRRTGAGGADEGASWDAAQPRASEQARRVASSEDILPGSNPRPRSALGAQCGHRAPVVAPGGGGHVHEQDVYLSVYRSIGLPQRFGRAL